MTLPSEPPPPPPLDAPPARDSDPVPVIGYASGETIAVATTGVRVLLGFIAALHLLVGLPLVASAVLGTVGNVASGYADPAAILSGFIGLIIGAVDGACGVWVILRRPWTWRAAHFGLAALCVLELIVCGFGAGFVVAYKDTTGWDALGTALGVLMFAVGSVLFWLHALSKLALLRINVRRAFFIDGADLPRVHRIGTIVMIALYGAVVLVGGVAYLVR